MFWYETCSAYVHLYTHFRNIFFSINTLLEKILVVYADTRVVISYFSTV